MICVHSELGIPVIENPKPTTGQQRPTNHVSYVRLQDEHLTLTTYLPFRFLPDSDRQYMSRSRMTCIPDDDYDEYDNEVCDHDQQLDYFEHNAKRVDGNPTSMGVSVIQSPVLNTFYKHHPVQLTLDTDATTNLIRASSARAYGFPMKSASQQTRQADGVTPLNVIGEIHCHLTRGDTSFQLDALVVQQTGRRNFSRKPFLSQQ